MSELDDARNLLKWAERNLEQVQADKTAPLAELNRAIDTHHLAHRNYQLTKYEMKQRAQCKKASC